MIEKRCIICTHDKRNHLPYGGKRKIIILPEFGKHWCEDCTRVYCGVMKAFHTFKLDNLSYIEALAKKRNLL